MIGRPKVKVVSAKESLKERLSKWSSEKLVTEVMKLKRHVSERESKIREEQTRGDTPLG
jgi:hypothetical protein